MAIAGLPSIVDFARMCAPDGSPALHIAQLLSQCNQIMKDLIYREGNLPLGNKITVGTGLPQGTWRGANAGVGFSKMLTAQLEDSIGIHSWIDHHTYNPEQSWSKESSAGLTHNPLVLDLIQYSAGNARNNRDRLMKNDSALPILFLSDDAFD